MFTWCRPPAWVTAVRDASVSDMARLHIARMMENADWASCNDVLLAIIENAALHHTENNLQSPMRWEEFAKLKGTLETMLQCTPKSIESQSAPADFADWMMPGGVYASQMNAESFQRKYAYYWTTDQWKRDFLTALEQQFWTYKDYAHGAGKGKMALLRELAEVWVAAATTALVRYGENEKRGWRKTADMLRRHADMIEADGLRALPWGAWGHMQEVPPPKIDAKSEDG